MNKPTIKEVEEWVMTLYNTCEETITDAERREQHKYATMVQRPQDKKFLVKMLDESSQDLGARGDYNSTIGSYYSEALDADYSCTIYAYLYDLENTFLGSGYDCITWNTADMTGIENVTTTRHTTSDDIHDLSGRKLSTVSAAKGIYIRNGKKYVR